MENNTAQKTYDAKFDLVKFALAILVLAIHSTLWPEVLYPWLRIAVPLFFMISSYFLFSKLSEARPEKHKKILKSFVFRNLKLYLLWFLLLLPFTLYLRREAWFSLSPLENVWIIFRSALFDSTFVASWFITATVLGTLLVYALCKLLKNNCAVFLLTLAAFVFVTLSSSWHTVLADTALLRGIDGYLNVFGSLANSYPAALFWVFFGKIFAEKKEVSLPTPLLSMFAVVGAVALFAEWKWIASLDGGINYDSYFSLAPLCLSLFALLQKVKPICWAPSVYFKRASTVLYVLHGTAVLFVAALVKKLFRKPIPLLSFCITLVGCIAVYFLLEVLIAKCREGRAKNLLKLLY